MKYNWEEIKWIFKPDGSLRDIYVQEVDLSDWEKVIDLLNEKYSLRYNNLENESKIDKDYVLKYLQDETGEMESRTVSIIIDDISINCHFFLIDQIEFDILPNEVNNEINFKKVISFMENISDILKKQITLTGDNEVEFPLIKIDVEKNIFKIITENEIGKHYLKYNNPIINYFYTLRFKFLMRFFPKYLENKIIKSASQPIKSTKLRENKW